MENQQSLSIENNEVLLFSKKQLLEQKKNLRVYKELYEDLVQIQNISFEELDLYIEKYTKRLKRKNTYSYSSRTKHMLVEVVTQLLYKTKTHNKENRELLKLLIENLENLNYSPDTIYDNISQDRLGLLRSDYLMKQHEDIAALLKVKS